MSNETEELTIEQAATTMDAAAFRDWYSAHGLVGTAKQQPQTIEPPTPVVSKVASQPAKPGGQPKPEPKHRAPWEAFGTASPEVQEAVDAIEAFDLAGSWKRADDQKAAQFQQDLDDQDEAQQKASEERERVPGWTY